MNVYPPGTKVRLAKIGECDDGIEGVITRINISGGERVYPHKEGAGFHFPNFKLQYEISWWNGRERRQGWFEPFEIFFPEKPDLEKVSIGFHSSVEVTCEKTFGSE